MLQNFIKQEFSLHQFVKKCDENVNKRRDEKRRISNITLNAQFHALFTFTTSIGILSQSYEAKE